ncbi:MAG: DUF1186 family protein [Desulfobacterales bacterium]|nr:DUF1186 family protein [Pseudomonadota bacterium]MBU4354254.1 DUF1186 family protein [Pseudomonadota bacterium]MCG2770859.1 DUF1186 family protein [Desulfobacterales bacterium]
MPGDEISAILQALERFSGKYEQEAVDAAIAHREEITPYLIDCLEKVAADPSIYLEDEGYYLHIYAFMLLGHFQETRAHQAVVGLFSLPGNILDELFGDLTTEYLAMVLFRTCGGDFNLIKSLILNQRALPYARGEAARALVYAVVAGQLLREEALTFLSTLFTGDEAEPLSPFWGTIVDNILDLYPQELMPVIEDAAARGLLDGGYVVEADFDRALGSSIDKSLEYVRQEMERRPWNDLHSLMSGWSCFHEEQWAPYSIPADAPTTKNPKPQKKKKKKMAKASRRKNRR